MPWEIEFDHLPIGYSVTSAKPGDKVMVSTIEFSSTEGGDHFISRLEGLPSEVLNKITSKPSIQPSAVEHMLLIIRPDSTATAYVNELQIKMLMQPKRDVKAGEAVFTNDIADIKEIQFENVKVPNDCGVLFLFSAGWRKGLYYDFSPLHPKDGEARHYNLNERLAQYYQYLWFQERFKISDDAWNQMFSQGWFPFISLTRNSTQELINHAAVGWNIDDILPTISNEVRSSLPNWLKKWKKIKPFSPHVELLKTAVERFLQKDFVSTVSILYPRIEGVMRNQHLSVSSENNSSQKNLVNSTFVEVNSDSNPKLLLLPERFSKYLTAVYFASFDPKNPKGASRNTVSHGVADPKEFSEKISCIGFLILDQLTYFLASEKGFNDSLQSSAKVNH